MIVEHPIFLNVSGRSMGQTVYAVQNDTGRRFRIKFKDYNISSYSAGTLDWEGPNGATGYISGNINNGALVVDPSSLLVYEGPFKCTATVNGVSSVEFILDIEKALDESGWTPPPEPEDHDVTVEPLSVTENGTYTAPTGTAYSPVAVNVQGSGGVDLDWIEASTPTPNVRNFFNALKTGAYEHGEYTPTNLPNNAFVDVFTLTTIQAPPKGIIFIDKNFYQGISSFPHMSSESLSFCWWDKSFINPAADSSTYPKYYAFKIATDQTRTTVASHGATAFVTLDGSTQTFRARWQFSGQTLQVKVDYTNNTQYTPFERNRTYIWIAY